MKKPTPLQASKALINKLEHDLDSYKQHYALKMREIFILKREISSLQKQLRDFQNKNNALKIGLGSISDIAVSIMKVG